MRITCYSFGYCNVRGYGVVCYCLFVIVVFISDALAGGSLRRLQSVVGVLGAPGLTAPRVVVNTDAGLAGWVIAVPFVRIYPPHIFHSTSSGPLLK